jgi:hypothetical protein
VRSVRGQVAAAAGIPAAIPQRPIAASMAMRIERPHNP